MIIPDNDNQDQGTASNNKIMEADSSAVLPPPPYVASETPSDLSGYVPIQNHQADHTQPLLLRPSGSPLKRFVQAFAVAILLIFLARSLLLSVYLASSGHRHGGRHTDLPTQKPNPLDTNSGQERTMPIQYPPSFLSSRLITASTDT